MPQGARPFGGSPQFNPGFKSNRKWVEGSNVFGKAIVGPLFFSLKRSKQAVPNNQDAAMIFVKVFQVTAVVYPVVRQCIENCFQRTG